MTVDEIDNWTDRFIQKIIESYIVKMYKLLDDAPER